MPALSSQALSPSHTSLTPPYLKRPEPGPWPQHGRCAGQPSLAEARPDLVAQWHPTRNQALTPEAVTCGSARRVWWLCRAGVCGHDHEWQVKPDVALPSQWRGVTVCTRRQRRPSLSRPGPPTSSANRHLLFDLMTCVLQAWAMGQGVSGAEGWCVACASRPRMLCLGHAWLGTCLVHVPRCSVPAPEPREGAVRIQDSLMAHLVVQLASQPPCRLSSLPDD